MLLTQSSLQHAIDNAATSLFALQDSEGFWLDTQRSLDLSLAYATALLAAGSDPRCDVLQDLCQDVQSYARVDGGFSDCATARSRPDVSQHAVQLLELCRPAASLLPAARRYLAQAVPDPRTTRVTHWLLDPGESETILDARPPLRLLARLVDGPLSRLTSSGGVRVAAKLERRCILGRASEAEALSAAIGQVQYRRGGLISSTTVAATVLDSALTARALLACGVSQSEPHLQAARTFLEQARCPAGGWPRAWTRADGSARQRDVRTDSTSAVVLTLSLLSCTLAEGERSALIAQLARSQLPSGAFSGAVPANDAAGACLATTTRALQALHVLGVPLCDPRLSKAVAWLEMQQDREGGWRCEPPLGGPPYGLALALEALLGVGHLAPAHPSLQRALNLLRRNQNAGGGWGFDLQGKRVQTSTVEHTALAVYALCHCSRPRSVPTNTVEFGVRWLLNAQRADGTWPAAPVYQRGDQRGYTSLHHANIFALQALAAYRSAYAAYLPAAGALLHSSRLTSKKRAPAGARH